MEGWIDSIAFFSARSRWNYRFSPWQTARMAASKTLLDLLQRSKRQKVSSSVSSSSTTSSPKSLILPVSSLTHAQSLDPQQTPPSSPSPALTAHQKSHIEFNEGLAKSKRNLTICSQKVSNYKVTPQFPFTGYLEYGLFCFFFFFFLCFALAEGVGFIELEELLVEETWLDTLAEEFKKAYAKTLCRFLEQEMCGSAHLSSTALDLQCS